MIEAEIMDRGDGAREGEDDGNIRLFQPNPFLQPPILKALFQQLSLAELAKCRLVNNLWNRESLSIWRYKATLQLKKKGFYAKPEPEPESNSSPPLDISKCWDFWDEDIPPPKILTTIREFLDLWEAEKWSSCPFRKFNLNSWEFAAGNVDQHRFLEVVGENVTTLTLDNCFAIGRDNFRKIIYSAFPNLQILKVHGYIIEHTLGTPYHQGDMLQYEEPAFGLHKLKSLDTSLSNSHSMLEVLSHFHQLISLKVWMRTPTAYRNLLEAIRLIRTQDKRKLPLKDFDVGTVPFDVSYNINTSIEMLELQRELNFPLQRLKIIGYEEYDEDDNLRDVNEVVRNILQYHSSALKYLEFDEEDFEKKLSSAFPFGVYLEKLEELIIPLFRSENLNYLRYMPNLRILKIWKGY